MKNETLIADARRAFHQRLISFGVLTIDKNGIPSNADTGNKPSCAIGGLVGAPSKAWHNLRNERSSH